MKKFIAIALIMILAFAQITPSYSQSPAPETTEQVYIDCPTGPEKHVHTINPDEKTEKFMMKAVAVFVAAWAVFLAALAIDNN